MQKLAFLLMLGILATGLCFFPKKEKTAKNPPAHAGSAFFYWGMARTFPDGIFHTEKYSEAMDEMRLSTMLRGNRSPDWEPIGPDNIGGRTLCLAIHPSDTNVLWMGSASGGLWKSNTAGKGAKAWQRVETGFPVLGVSTIAIDPSNPQHIYVGTGEVYNLDNSAPNVAVRTTRGTYGIGILKSEDGGLTWKKSLDWSYGQLRGVQHIAINPLRNTTVLAATTEGLLRSWDAGNTWHTIHAKRMAVDIEINPLDTNLIFVTHGSLDDNDVSGIYRSNNGGLSFVKLTGGLPGNYSGKTLIDLCAAQPNVLYASVGNAFSQQGLYKSNDNGTSWQLVNSTDVCKYQGWYSHDVAVHPQNPNTFVWVGIDTWKSVNSGASVQHKTYWYKWYFGEVPAGTSEGPKDYVHADIHHAYYVPGDPQKVYLVTDGGLFVSYDGGESWQGRNGGYQTQQFYANLGNSSTNPKLAIGGMQDNATAIYSGSSSWRRVLGGDGECAAIHPQNDQIMYGSYPYLNIFKSTDGGQNWYSVGIEISGSAAFNAPFEVAPSAPDVMYAGAQGLWRSDDGGESWYALTSGLADGDVVLSIAIDPKNADRVLYSTAPTTTDQARIFLYEASSQTATELMSLPNRLCMDLVFDPTKENRMYAVFAGFNTQHVWRSDDGGATWAAIDNGLPDVPTNSLLIDPATGHLYVGNDLGVWHSADEGASWSVYSANAPQAMLAMHLSIAPGSKLRVATYGLGVWQTDLAKPSGSSPMPAQDFALALHPNPASAFTVLHFELSKSACVSIRVADVSGRTVWQASPEILAAGKHARRVPTSSLPPGHYAVLLETDEGWAAKKLELL